MTEYLFLILIFVLIGSTIIGYFLISNVPSLLHTPLMSGTNALSGVTLVGALIATAVIYKNDSSSLAGILGGIAIISATINIFGGFLVTDRMLKMFKKKDKKDD